MPPWLELSPQPVSPELLAVAGGHPLLAQALAHRGLTDPATARAFLDPGHYRPTSAWELPDMERAVERVALALARREPIAVWGDFDVDGQTATALLVSALRSLGGDVVYHIPVREAEGHGVNIARLDALLDRGVGLVLTCDTGVSSHAAVEHARRRGVDVVVTDHHDLPPALPPAQAVVNPKRLPAAHPLATLPGVGVAYKLVEALLERLGRGEEAQAYLDLTALGIVADLALLAGDTRYLLQRGLVELRRTRRLGLQRLLAAAEVSPAHLNEEHVAFALAPRLNALGRLDDANPIVEFLATDDPVQAGVMAQRLEALNAKRQWMTRQVLQAALDQVQRDPALLAQPALVLSNPSWPAGVIGIVASHLVERFGRPTLLIAAPPGELARGSARSVPGVNITAAIAAAAQDDHGRPLLAGYGGHPMAAGVSLPPDHLPAFVQRLQAAVQAEAHGRVEQPLAVLATLGLSDLTLELALALERLAPFGPGNPPPVLAVRGLRLVSHREIGRHREHRLVTVEDDAGVQAKVLWWNGAGWPLPMGVFDLAVTVRAATFRGQPGVQLEWQDARGEAEAPIELWPPPIPVVDHRGVADPRGELEALRAAQGADQVAVWCEGDDQAALGGYDRYSLPPAPVLAVWTAPPSRRELQAALHRVAPLEVHVFAAEPPPGDLDGFLRRLAGLVKHTLAARQGRTSVAALAAATAQTEAAVRFGLDWLAARGVVTASIAEAGEVQLAAGGHRSDDRARLVAAQLRAVLEETAAYRAYFARAAAPTLIE
ncbi:MAG: single-stranded-DNA-specific exonuclease RecJ [Caldilineales bacterium]|nr:single-stranded-DNA-specific exonuclease RecJ [Caldilineales bacterium]